MKKYDIEVAEDTSRVITIEADSFEKAQSIAEEMYYNGEIVLEYNDFNSVDFKPYPEVKIKEDFSLEVDFNKGEKTIVINGTPYKCDKKDDLIFSIKDYIEKNVKFNEVEPIEYKQEMNKKEKELER